MSSSELNKLSLQPYDETEDPFTKTTYLDKDSNISSECYEGFRFKAPVRKQRKLIHVSPNSHYPLIKTKKSDHGELSKAALKERLGSLPLQSESEISFDAMNSIWVKRDCPSPDYAKFSAKKKTFTCLSPVKSNNNKSLVDSYWFLSDDEYFQKKLDRFANESYEDKDRRKLWKNCDSSY